MEISSDVPLKDGEAVVEKKSSKELKLTYNQTTGRYLEKKVLVFVMGLGIGGDIIKICDG